MSFKGIRFGANPRWFSLNSDFSNVVPKPNEVHLLQSNCLGYASERTWKTGKGKKNTNQQIDDRCDDNSPVTTQIWICNKSPKERKHGRHSWPVIHVLCSSSSTLTQNICEVSHQIWTYACIGKPLCYLHSCEEDDDEICQQTQQILHYLRIECIKDNWTHTNDEKWCFPSPSMSSANRTSMEIHWSVSYKTTGWRWMVVFHFCLVK